MAFGNNGLLTKLFYSSYKINWIIKIMLKFRSKINTMC